jgi:hypothetical protein
MDIEVIVSILFPIFFQLGISGITNDKEDDVVFMYFASYLYDTTLWALLLRALILLGSLLSRYSVDNAVLSILCHIKLS